MPLDYVRKCGRFRAMSVTSFKATFEECRSADMLALTKAGVEGGSGGFFQSFFAASQIAPRGGQDGRVMQADTP